MGLLVGLFLELYGIGHIVRFRIGQATISMGLGGFLIALSLGLLAF